MDFCLIQLFAAHRVTRTGSSQRPDWSVALGPLQAALVGSLATTLGIVVMYWISRFGRGRIMRFVDNSQTRDV